MAWQRAQILLAPVARWLLTLLLGATDLLLKCLVGSGRS
ncbi:hypothetical protein ABIA33_001331 [Streptacidiphilus sp. MAP12-16]